MVGGWIETDGRGIHLCTAELGESLALLQILCGAS